MLPDRLLMHCGEIFKTIPFRNDSSYVSYIFSFSLYFFLLTKDWKTGSSLLKS